MVTTPFVRRGLTTKELCLQINIWIILWTLYNINGKRFKRLCAKYCEKSVFTATISECTLNNELYTDILVQNNHWACQIAKNLLTSSNIFIIHRFSTHWWRSETQKKTSSWLCQDPSNPSMPRVTTDQDGFGQCTFYLRWKSSLPIQLTHPRDGNIAIITAPPHRQMTQTDEGVINIWSWLWLVIWQWKMFLIWNSFAEVGNTNIIII